MKPIFIDFDNNSHESLYVQLYNYLKHGIVSGEIGSGERLPSLRELARQLGVSITTCSRAYDQLLVEGYIEAKPQSGYYVNDLEPGMRSQTAADLTAADTASEAPSSQAETDRLYSEAGRSEKTDDVASGFSDSLAAAALAGITYYCDTECFDFRKWRKCAAEVMTDRVEELLLPADPQGEYALRQEIYRYLYTSRGVTARPEQIVISAGVQQLTNHLARILSYMKINLVNVEDPGYKPVRHIFRDRGFTINKIPVGPDGIEIEKLPVNLASAVYVSPSNQFPTGSVMPAARRYSLLRWADENGSIIIEDDYDSELRYFGDPVPALKSLDDHGCTVYLGSFSSTLFPAIRISYMVLPDRLAGFFNAHKNDYDQTCSKIEQLTLASFMGRGFYQQGIRKVRKLYARKLALVIKSFREYGGDLAAAENTGSGISVRLNVKTDKTAAELCKEAGSVKLHMIPFKDGSAPAASKRLIFYYDQIPKDAIEPAIQELCATWAK